MTSNTVVSAEKRTVEHLLALATADGAVLVVLTVAAGTEATMLVVGFQPEPGG